MIYRYSICIIEKIKFLYLNYFINQVIFRSLFMFNNKQP
ncbi:hypothetical protein XBFFL1_230009 [Xenorhabdus bovienii str. feltiae Florida]|nr:hypothetical protein XBFFR1_2450007 [Xenorhabdus bovienii str. feltiae France]CDG92754.1 hypothetical protein XBFFL1_230009 [Xenorhabdus bovienii str. feltiae Florida]